MKKVLTKPLVSGCNLSFARTTVIHKWIFLNFAVIFSDFYAQWPVAAMPLRTKTFGSKFKNWKPKGDSVCGECDLIFRFCRIHRFSQLSFWFWNAEVVGISSWFDQYECLFVSSFCEVLQNTLSSASRIQSRGIYNNFDRSGNIRKLCTGLLYDCGEMMW